MARKIRRKSSSKSTWLKWPCRSKRKSAQVYSSSPPFQEVPDDEEDDDDDDEVVDEIATRIKPQAPTLNRLSFQTAAAVVTNSIRERRRRRTPRFNSVSKIDRISRVFFPFVFFLINLFYWYSYLTKSERWATAPIMQRQ